MSESSQDHIDFTDRAKEKTFDAHLCSSELGDNGKYLLWIFCDHHVDQGPICECRLRDCRRFNF